MKRIAIPILFALAAGIAAIAAAPRERISINDNWRFTNGDPTALSRFNRTSARRSMDFAW